MDLNYTNQNTAYTTQFNPPPEILERGDLISKFPLEKTVPDLPAILTILCLYWSFLYGR